MRTKERTPVVDKSGAIGLLKEQLSSSMVVELAEGGCVLIPADRLELQKDGSYLLTGSFLDYGLGSDTDGAQLAAGGKITIPIVEEELDIQKNMVELARVRLSKTVRQREELVNIPLVREEVEVRRVPVNRDVAGPVAVRYEGGTLIVPLLEEVLVVEKRLVLKEELHISKVRKRSSHRERVLLRKEEAVIERSRSRKKEEGSEKRGRRNAAGSNR